MSTLEKRCADCGETKAEEEFKRGAKGLRPWCRACGRKRSERVSGGMRERGELFRRVEELEGRLSRLEAVVFPGPRDVEE